MRAVTEGLRRSFQRKLTLKHTGINTDSTTTQRVATHLEGKKRKQSQDTGVKTLKKGLMKGDKRKKKSPTETFVAQQSKHTGVTAIYIFC